MEKFGLNASDSSPQPDVPSQVLQRPQQQLSQRKVEREKESDKKNAEIQDTKQSQAQKQQLQKKQQGEHYEKQQQNLLTRKPSPEGDKKPAPAPAPIVKKSPETEEERFHTALSRIFSVAFTREDASVQMVTILKLTILLQLIFPYYQKKSGHVGRIYLLPNLHKELLNESRPLLLSEFCLDSVILEAAAQIKKQDLLPYILIAFTRTRDELRKVFFFFFGVIF